MTFDLKQIEYNRCRKAVFKFLNITNDIDPSLPNAPRLFIQRKNWVILKRGSVFFLLHACKEPRYKVINEYTQQKAMECRKCYKLAPDEMRVILLMMVKE